MGPDLNTTWLIGCLSEAGFGILLLVVSAQFPTEYRRPATAWGFSTITFGIYYFLALNHLKIGDFFFEVLAFALIVLSLSLQVLAIADIKQANSRFRLILFAPIVFACIAVFFVFVQRNISIKQFIFNTFDCFILILLTRLCFLSSKGKLGFRSDRILGSCYLFLSIAIAIILVHFGFRGFPAQYDYGQPRARLNTVMSVVANILISPLFLLMVSVRLNDSMKSAAMRDYLTGLYNRRAFEEICRRTRASAIRNGQPYSVFLLDIDGFKSINDRHGHAAGDLVLVEVSRALRSTVREEDYICRWGGDEFFGILPRAEEPEALLAIQRIQAAVASLRLSFADEPVKLNVSIGLVTDRGNEADFAAIIDRADTAMYSAKGSGGNSYRVSQAA